MFVSGIKLVIWDSDGNNLFNDSIASPIVGLQAGETFWFGAGSEKFWAKVTKIYYGFDTSLKQFRIDIYIEKTDSKSTKQIINETIDYGEIDIKIGARRWSEKGIILSLQKISHEEVEGVTIQVEDNGQIFFNRDNLTNGDSLMVEADSRNVECVLVNFSGHTNAVFRVFETKKR